MELSPNLDDGPDRGSFSKVSLNLNEIVFDAPPLLLEERRVTRLDNSTLAAAITAIAKPEKLALERFEQALTLVAELPKFNLREKGHLEFYLRELQEDKAIQSIRQRDKENAPYHHPQVLYNMVRILCEDEHNFEYNVDSVRGLLTVALLHDIGTGLCKSKKAHSGEIQVAFERVQQAPVGEREPLRQQAIALAKEAIRFRLEHMEIGAGLATELLAPYVGRRVLREVDVNCISKAIAVHDYPSIEKVLGRLREKTGTADESLGSPGQYLLPYSNPAIGGMLSLLRAADRLDMLSLSGVLFDVLHAQKDVNQESITLDSIKQQGRKNFASHAGEYTLYKKAGRDDGRFIGQTLYRNAPAYRIYLESGARYGAEPPS